MITLEEAKQRQDEWLAQGTRLLQEFPIITELDKLGQVEVEGSFSYKLMVKPDIDIHLFTDSVNLEDIAELARRVTLMNGVSRVLVSNKLVKTPDPGMPVGVYLGIKRFIEEVEWNFDIWIMREENYISSEFSHMNTLPDETYELLLWLKYQLKEVGMYPGSSKIPTSFSSADLYRAVLRDDCKTLDELIEWRQKHPLINQT